MRNRYHSKMFEENVKLIMKNGKTIAINEIKTNSYVMCEDGDIAKVTAMIRDLQTTYEIVQVTKHKDETHVERPIFHRIQFNCSLGHILELSVPSTPKLEKSLKHERYLVKIKKLVDFQTTDGRIIVIPKDKFVNFPLTTEGEYQARNYMETVRREQPTYIDFRLELRDIDYLNSHIRLATLMRYSPVINGNGILSEFLTGQKHLITSAVLGMAWLLGLWIGDGTTRHPEISMDSHDISLWQGLLKNVSPWGLVPTYKDACIPLRAKHVKLYYGTADSKRKHQMFRTNNPFWKCLVKLDFKNKKDGTKKIPEFMWHDDIEVRESFLAGLIDADGYVAYGEKNGDVFGVSIQTIYPSVMNGVINVARSLGIKASVTTKPERENIIENRVVQCKFTYECTLVGESTLQNVLSKCQSGHKKRPKPVKISREPIRFHFEERKRGLNWVYGFQTDKDKTILLSNYVVVTSCNNHHCHTEQKKFSPDRNRRRCKACSKINAKCCYKDWTGRHNLCSRCRARYVVSGYRCLECHYVPDQRSIKKLKRNDMPLKCDRCQGSYYYDPIRGPINNKMSVLPSPSKEQNPNKIS